MTNVYKFAPFIFALFTQNVYAEQSWTAKDIGLLGSGRTVAYGLNASGQIVGLSTTDHGDRAFITDTNGTNIRMLETPTQTNGRSTAYSINNNGSVVGSYYATDGRTLGFRTGANGTNLITLGALGGVITEGTDINSTGQVAGYSFTGGFTGEPILAFITPTSGSQIFPLYNTSTGNTGSDARGINDTGQVVGVLYLGNQKFSAFATYSNGSGLLNFGALGGVSSFGIDINNSGQVLGNYISASGLYKSFVTEPDFRNPRDIGGLLNGVTTAKSINNFGQIVGTSLSADGYRAFYTQRDSTDLIDLNSVVKLEAGVYLYDAHGINDSGQIAALGTNGHSYLLTPSMIPEPPIYYSLLLGVIALFGKVGTPKGKSRSSLQPRPNMSLNRTLHSMPAFGLAFHASPNTVLLFRDG